MKENEVKIDPPEDTSVEEPAMSYIKPNNDEDDGTNSVDRRSSRSSGNTRTTYNYVNMIVECILHSPTNRVLLSEIYNHVKKNYKDMIEKGVDWQNGVRHNLSLNDCFLKDGRNPNGKGYFWTIASKNMSYFQKGDFRRRWSQCRTRRQRDGSESRRQSSFLLQPPSFHTYPRGNTYQNMNPMVNTSGSQSGSSYCDRKNYQCLPVEANPYPNGYHTGQGSPLNNYYQNVPSSIYQGPHYPSYHEQASSSALPCYHYGNYPDSYSYSYVSPSQGQIMEPLPSEQVLIQSPHRTADRQSQERVRDPPDHSMSTIINKL